MGILSPNNQEYNLEANFIVEALRLRGQECTIYFVDHDIKDADRDELYYYKEPIQSNILFSENVRDAELKHGNKWKKEGSDYLEAYIGLPDMMSMSEGVIVEINPSFFNSSSKFTVTKIFGQVNSYYARVRLVPFRNSLKTDLDNNKENNNTIVEDNIIKRKPMLKR